MKGQRYLFSAQTFWDDFPFILSVIRDVGALRCFPASIITLSASVRKVRLRVTNDMYSARGRTRLDD